MEPAWIKARERLERAVAEYTDARNAGITGASFGAVQRILGDAKKRFENAEQRCITNVLNSADVVVSTCIGAGSETLRSFVNREKIRFSTVLIDEAAQCMESATLPPLVLGCERLILIGDQNQLPPVVSCPTALEHGLGVSLFSRLAAGGLEPALLNEQYRMHPKIAEFPSRRFYGGRVHSKVDSADRPLPTGFPWPNRRIPVCFVDVSPQQTSSRLGRSLDDENVGFMDPLEYPDNNNNNNNNNNNSDKLTANSSSYTAASAAAAAATGSANALLFQESVKLSDGSVGTRIIGVGASPVGGGFEMMSNSSATQASYYNEREADVLVDVLKGLIGQKEPTTTTTATTSTSGYAGAAAAARGVSLADVGVITPYNAQVGCSS
jgi:hypothetical protein